MLPKCENYYQTFYGDGRNHYVRCKVEEHPRHGLGCYPENKCVGRNGQTRCNGIIVKHYCPPTGSHPHPTRERKDPAKDPDLVQSIQSDEDPTNYGKWGDWAMDFLDTTIARDCTGFTWTPADLTDWTKPGCLAYRESKDLSINNAPVAGRSGSLLDQTKDHEDQEITTHDECGRETVTIFGAANLGYGDTDRALYAFDSGSGCAADVTSAEAAETWEWPLLRVHHNMVYNYIASSSYENDGSNGYTQYLLINGCFAFLSVRDSGVTPTQRSATWPTFDADGNLVASNPC